MKARRLSTRRLRLEELETRLTPSSTTSTNWSGYAVQASAGAVTAVAGSWVVPTVTGTGTAYSSAWVGIDGYNSNSVEQIGTDSDVVNGVPTYYAWYEMYPNPSSTVTALVVHPGDTIQASVTYSSGKFTLAITDVTTSKTFSTTQTAASAQRSSAEWVEEAPSSNSGVLPLADFGTVNFSGAQAVINGATGAIDNSAWSSGVEQINMVSSRGASEDTTSKLTDTGSASGFSVTWVSNGTSVGTSGTGGGGGPGPGGGGGGRGGWGWGWGWRSVDQPADQTTLVAVANQAGQQTQASRATTQPIITSPSALGAPVSLPAGVPAGGPAAVSTPAGAAGNLSSLFGPSRAGLANSLAAPALANTGGGDENDQPPSEPAADGLLPPQVPAPMEVPGEAVGPLAVPAVQLSDACFLAEGGALARPEDAGPPDATGQPLLSVEGGADALFCLALGGLVGVAAEKSTDRRRVLNLR
jgi:hypothetical protein